MLGTREQIGHPRAFDDFSRVHDRDLLGHFRNHPEVMGYQENGCAEVLL